MKSLMVNLGLNSMIKRQPNVLMSLIRSEWLHIFFPLPNCFGHTLKYRLISIQVLHSDKKKETIFLDSDIRLYIQFLIFRLQTETRKQTPLKYRRQPLDSLVKQTQFNLSNLNWCRFEIQRQKQKL